MPSSDAKSLRWLWWTLLAIFTIIGMVIDWKLLPRDHWSRHFVYLAAMLLAQLCTTLVLRRLGLSQEARHAETWPRKRREEAMCLNSEYELRHPQWHLYVFVPLCVFLVLGLLCAYLFIPPSQQQGRELALPLIGIFLFSGVFLWYCFSRPIVRVDSRGISGAFSRLIPWSEITGCRSEERHNAQGDVVRHRIEVLGRMGNLLTVYEITDTPTDERVRFCEALRRVLTKE